MEKVENKIPEFNLEDAYRRYGEERYKNKLN